MLWDILSIHQDLLADQIAFCDEKQMVTYGYLPHIVETYSRQLLQAGVKPDDKVIIMLFNSVEFIISFLSLYRIGAVSILLDYRLTENELNHIFSKTKAKFVITDKSIKTNNPLSHLPLPLLAIKERQKRISFPPSRNGLFLMHTSGVSGEPKIVIKTWQKLLADSANFAESAEYSSSDRILCTTSLHHSYSISTCVAPALISGASLYLNPVPIVPRHLIDQIHQKKITVLQAVPLIYNILTQLTAEKVQNHSFRLCLAAGEPLREFVAEKFLQIFNIPITTHYGTTEAGAITLNTNQVANSVGQPIANVCVKIIDSDDNELPAGESGELIVTSPGISDGYFGNAELTELRFQGGWFSTGDIAVKDHQGNIRLLGRMNELINVAGNKVDPIEVEKVIDQCPGVEQSLVIGVTSESTGEEVIAIVVAKNKIDQAEIQAFLSLKLSSYKLPKKILFAKELPRSKNGKLLRKMISIPELRT